MAPRKLYNLERAENEEEKFQRLKERFSASFQPEEKSDMGKKAARLLCLQESKASPAPSQNGAIHKNVKMRGAHFPGAALPIPVALSR